MTKLEELKQEYIKQCWLEVLKNPQRFYLLVLDEDGYCDPTRYKHLLIDGYVSVESCHRPKHPDYNKSSHCNFCRPTKLKNFKLNNGWVVCVDEVILPKDSGLYHVEVGKQIFPLHFNKELKTWFRVNSYGGYPEPYDKYIASDDMKWIIAWRPYEEIPKRLY